nr:immunoglobulin light chain junction region [Macaca mulatta]
CMQGLRFPYTF